MLVTMKSAEHSLLKALTLCKENNPAQRCLRFKLALSSSHEHSPEDAEQVNHLAIEENEYTSKICKILATHIPDEHMQIYLCRNNEIFVISRIITHKSVKRILAHLTETIPPAYDIKLADLFEVGFDWRLLKDICEKNIAALSENHTNTEKQQSSHINSITRDDALSTIDPDLLSSLPMRRDMRSNMQIMIVEDDPFSHKMVTNILGQHYSTNISEDGEGAILSYVLKAPDVLFLDIGLPDMNGHDVLKKIFELDKQAYVVMLSGNGDRDNIVRAIELGAKGFVGKPFSKDKLFQYIEKSPFVQAKKQEKPHGNLIN